MPSTTVVSVFGGNKYQYSIRVSLIETGSIRSMLIPLLYIFTARLATIDPIAIVGGTFLVDTLCSLSLTMTCTRT